MSNNIDVAAAVRDLQRGRPIGTGTDHITNNAIAKIKQIIGAFDWRHAAQLIVSERQRACRPWTHLVFMFIPGNSKS